MAEYRRFISYIYAYEGDMKTKNVGFAKIEARSGQCRISVSIKGAYECSGGELFLYGYGCFRGEFLLIPLGTIPVKNGAGEAVLGKQEDNLSGSGFGLDFVRGLFLRSRVSVRKAYLTTWDDTLFHISSLQKAPVVEKKEDLDTYLEAAEAGIREKDRQEAAAEPEKAPEVQETTAKAEEEKDEKEPERSEEPQEKQEEAEAALTLDLSGQSDQVLTLDFADILGKPPQEDAPEEPDKEPEKEPDQPEQDPFYFHEGYMELPLWESLKKLMPRKRALAEEGWEVLQIHLQDIGRLPRENWTYGNNSFVLHGYYQYRYLILARRPGAGRAGSQAYQYILGVPGIFKPQEKFMASMFGLPEFKRASAGRDENFGFWCGNIHMQP